MRIKYYISESLNRQKKRHAIYLSLIAFLYMFPVTKWNKYRSTKASFHKNVLENNLSPKMYYFL